MTKRKILFWSAEMVLIAFIGIQTLVFKQTDTPSSLIALSLMLILGIGNAIFSDVEKRRVKREQIEWIGLVKVRTHDILLPNGCTLEDLAHLLEPEEKQRLLEALDKCPRDQRNLRRVVDSLHPGGFF